MSRSRAQKSELSSIIPIFESRPHQILNFDISSIYQHVGEASNSEVKDKAYHTLLPVVKHLVQVYKEHPELEKRGEFRIACAVCPQLTQFRGWGPLLIHAQKFWKSFPLQHQGYHRALEEVLRVERFDSLRPDTLAWPPVLLVENGGLTFDGSFRRWKGLQGIEVPSNWQDMEIEEVLAVYRKGKGGDTDVMVFPASEVGLVDAKKLTEVLEKLPKSDDWVKFNVRKLPSIPTTSCTPEALCKHDGDDWTTLNAVKGRVQLGTEEIYEKLADVEDAPSTSGTSFDYDRHHPLGTWATLKEIRETSRVDSVMQKWAKSFASGRNYCTFKYRWPFLKSRKLKEMDIKFQQDLQNYHSLGAVGNKKLRAQLDEIEKQLRKERLLWLKEINAVREQFEGLEKDIKTEETHKALDKQIWEMRLERDIAAEIEKLEELIDEKDRVQYGRSSCKRRQQHIQKTERKRDAVLQAWRYEQNQFRKQAELAKEERECISKNIEHEEMLDTLSRVLEGCDCLHKDA